MARGLGTVFSTNTAPGIMVARASETTGCWKRPVLGCRSGSNAFVNSVKAGAGWVQSALCLTETLRLAAAGPGRRAKQEVALEKGGGCLQNPYPKRTRLTWRVTPVSTSQGSPCPLPCPDPPPVSVVPAAASHHSHGPDFGQWGLVCKSGGTFKKN